METMVDDNSTKAEEGQIVYYEHKLFKIYSEAGGNEVQEN